MGTGENAAKNTHNVIEELLFEAQPTGRKMVVLDLPCGEGAFTQRALERGAVVFSGDIADILEVDNHDYFRIVDMDQRFPFEDGHFTDIVCIDGIEHIERQFDFVRECHRTLKPTGHLIISTPNISSARSRWRYFLTGHHNKCKTPLNENKVSPLHHKGMLSFPELRYMLHTNGFQIVSIRSNRVKSVSWLYAIVYPFSYLAAMRTYLREEKEKEQRILNREIRKQMFRKDVFFGETLIVKAAKKG